MGSVKERDSKLDIIRVLAIICVVVIHVSQHYNTNLGADVQGDFIVAAIYDSLARIAVPLFFMLSGALCLGHDIPGKKLFHKILHFVLLLVFWTIFYLVFGIYYMGYTFTWKEDYSHLLFDSVTPHLWYLYAIIALYLIMPFARILVQHMTEKQIKYFMILWMIFSGVFRYVQLALKYYHITVDIENPVPLVQGSYYLGYFLMGYFIYDAIQNKRLHIDRVLCICLYLCSCAVEVLGTCLYTLRLGKYYKNFFNYRSLAVIFASLAIYCFVLEGKELKSDLAKKIFAQLSALSFGIYLVHIIFFDMFVKEIEFARFPAIWGVPFFTLMILILSGVLVFLLQKIPGIKKLVS